MRGSVDLIAFRNLSSLHLRRTHVEEIILHAKQASPAECCGLIGGTEDRQTTSIYPLTNISPNTQVTYEAKPEDLFAAQRLMRERGEVLLAIYHSHPRAVEPTPSETDVRLAYYPDAIYLIIGLAGNAPAINAFDISEATQEWQQVEYEVLDE